MKYINPIHLSPVHTSDNVEATLSNATSWTILSTMSNVASTLLPVSATMSNEISSFRQSRNKLNMFNLFRLCRKDEISFDIVAVCCVDKVEHCFDDVAGVDGALHYKHWVSHSWGGLVDWQNQNTLLHVAASSGHVDIVKYLCSGKDSLVNARNNVRFILSTLFIASSLPPFRYNSPSLVAI